LLYIPMFIGESAVFVGVFLMTLYAAMDIFNNYKKLRNTVSVEEGFDVNSSNT
jgi:TRAP-type C4-dicarboxylate transport system permease small subunit